MIFCFTHQSVVLECLLALCYCVVPVQPQIPSPERYRQPSSQALDGHLPRVLVCAELVSCMMPDYQQHNLADRQYRLKLGAVRLTTSHCASSRWWLMCSVILIRWCTCTMMIFHLRYEPSPRWCTMRYTWGALLHHTTDFTGIKASSPPPMYIRTKMPRELLKLKHDCTLNFPKNVVPLVYQGLVVHKRVMVVDTTLGASVSMKWCRRVPL